MIRFKNIVRSSDSPLIDLTPLIDVVFLLLIFFMVSTTFINASNIKIELPKVSQKYGVGQERELVIAIDASSHIFWDKKKVTPSELESAIRKTPETEKLKLLIQADEKTPHGTVVQVFDILRRNNVSRLRIATKLSSKEAAGTKKQL